MKKITLLGIFMLLQFYVSENSFALLPANVAEVIILIPDADVNRNIPSIETAIQGLTGVAVVGFCNSEKCLFLNVDRNAQATNDNIFHMIIEMGFHPDLKTSGTIQQAQDACKDR